MFDTVVIATDGSASAERAVVVSLDLAARFDATVHALYVLDTTDMEGSPEEARAEMRSALAEAGEEAIEQVSSRSRDGDARSPR